MASRAFPTQPAVPPLGGRCSLAVSANSSLSRASSGSAFVPALGDPFRPLVSRSRYPLGSSPRNPGRPVSTSTRDAPPKWRPYRASGRARCQGMIRSVRVAALTVLERPSGAACDRLEPATSERCSDRASVSDRLPLGSRSDRCSLDLSPSEVHLLDRWASALPSCACCRRLAASEEAACRRLRHFRVSIQSSLGAIRRLLSQSTAYLPNLHGVSDLVRPPSTLQPS
jgi:hypothetical protein